MLISDHLWYNSVAFFSLFVRRNVWRYQRGQNSLMAGQTTQWPKEKGQTTICKTLHIKLKIEHHWTQVSRKGIRSSCFTSGTRRATLDANSVISHERGKDQEVLALSGHLWHWYSVGANKVIPVVVTVNLSSDDFNLTNRNSWFGNFLASSNPLSKKSW